MISKVNRNLDLNPETAALRLPEPSAWDNGVMNKLKTSVHEAVQPAKQPEQTRDSVNEKLSSTCNCGLENTQPKTGLNGQGPAAF